MMTFGKYNARRKGAASVTNVNIEQVTKAVEQQVNYAASVAATAAVSNVMTSATVNNNGELIISTEMTASAGVADEA